MSLAVFVTGSSRGLGFEIARLHHARGDRVALLSRDRAHLDDAAARLGRAERLATFAVDVADRAALFDAIEGFRRSQGGIDRLYANAGAIERSGASPELDRYVFDVNFFGVVNTVEGFLRGGPSPGSGIAVLSSFSAFRGLPHIAAYGASKAAVSVYAESLRLRLRSQGISVTTAYFGYLDTEMRASRRISPLVTRASTAARLLVRAVDRGRSRIAYPWRVRAPVLLMRALPDAVYDRLVERRYRGGRP